MRASGHCDTKLSQALKDFAGNAGTMSMIRSEAKRTSASALLSRWHDLLVFCANLQIGQNWNSSVKHYRHALAEALHSQAVVTSIHLNLIIARTWAANIWTSKTWAQGKVTRLSRQQVFLSRTVNHSLSANRVRCHPRHACRIVHLQFNDLTTGVQLPGSLLNADPMDLLQRMPAPKKPASTEALEPRTTGAWSAN